MAVFTVAVNWLLIGLGLAYLGNSIYQTATHVREIVVLDLLREFGIPILLSLMFLPLLYALSVYIVYEQAFLGLQFGIRDNRLRRFAKRHAMLHFGLNIELLKRWRRQVLSLDIPSRETIRRTTREVKRTRRHEKEPPPIDLREGWSPYSAQIFLRDDGFTTNDYHRSFETWLASTPLIEVGENLFPDNLAYYVDGDQKAVKQVRLKLNVNSPDGGREAEKRFYEFCRKLLAIAVSDDASDVLMPLIEANDTLDETMDGRRVRLERDEFTGIRGGYSRTLIIDHSAMSGWRPFESS